MMILQADISDGLRGKVEAYVIADSLRNLDDLVSEALRRYLDAHLDDMTEMFIEEDIVWGLYGQD